MDVSDSESNPKRTQWDSLLAPKNRVVVEKERRKYESNMFGNIHKIRVNKIDLALHNCKAVLRAQNQWLSVLF